MIAAQVTSHSSFAIPHQAAFRGSSSAFNRATPFTAPAAKLGMAQDLRQHSRCKALPEISSELVAQTAVVGHAVKTLAFCSFAMIGIDASSKAIGYRTGNETINTLATSLAAIAIGALVANELGQMQDGLAEIKQFGAGPASVATPVQQHSLPEAPKQLF